MGKELNETEPHGPTRQRRKKPWLLGAFSLLLLCVAAFFAAPYFTSDDHKSISLAFKRISSAEKIEVEFQIACAGSGGGPRLYRVPVAADAPVPVLLRLPEGLSNPEDSDAAVPGNRFSLRGYWASNEQGQSRIDLIAWQAIVPYQVFDKDMQLKTMNSPLGEKLNNESGVEFTNVHYGAFSCP